MFNLKSLFTAAIAARFPKAPKHAPMRQVQAFGTFRAGRNEEKRAARRRERLLRWSDVAARNEHYVECFDILPRVPKRNASRLTVNLLSSRRLRQRGLACVLALFLIGSTVHVQTNPTWICPNGQSGIPPNCG